MLSDIIKVKDAAENLLRISNNINYNYGAYGFAYLVYYYNYTQKVEVVNYTFQRAKDLIDSKLNTDNAVTSDNLKMKFSWMN